MIFNMPWIKHVPIPNAASRRLASWAAFIIVILGAGLKLTGTTPARAEDAVVRGQSDDENDPDNFSSRRRRRLSAIEDDDAPRTSYRREENSTVGVEGRLGHLGFKTFGRGESISHVELLPYVLMDMHMLFNDSRLFVTNDGKLGGNVGLGYRYFSDSLNRVFGASVWYDIDDTTGLLYHQAGLSFETYGDHWDARSNLYLPVSDTQKTYSRKMTNQRFSGTEILFDQYRNIGAALAGVDVELGGTLPSEFSPRHRLRAYAGFYHFDGDAPAINGVRARFEGSFNDYIAAQTEFTHDDTFGTNVLLGIDLTFSGGSPRRRTAAGNNTDKLRRFSQRNYNIIVSRTGVWDKNLVAIDPATGLPYRVAHVDTNSAGANDGSVGDPFQTLALAQASGAGIVYVHTGSVLADPITLVSGQRMLGEGSSHSFFLTNFGNVALPNAGGTGPTPTILNAVGDAVTLASNSEFSGFNIDSPTGNGIVSPAGVSNAYVSQVSILNAGLDGVLVQNGTGSLTFRQMSIQNATGVGFHVNGGDSSLFFSGSIVNSNDRALIVENTTGGAVDFGQASIVDNGGDGILVSNNAGSVVVGSSTLTNTTGDGIVVLGGTGNVSFSGTTTVQNAGGNGIDVSGAAGAVTFNNAQVTGSTGNNAVNVANNTGSVHFGRLDATSDNGTALRVTNTGGLTIADGTLNAVDGPAVDIDNTESIVWLTSVSADGGAFGINLVNTPGQFVVWGGSTLGSGGLIQNATTGVNINNAGYVGLQRMDLDANDVGVSAVSATTLELRTVRVTNSTNFGIDALNTQTLLVTTSDFLNNGGAGGNSIRAQATAAGTYAAQFLTNYFEDASDGAISYVSSGAGDGSSLNLLVNGNEITTALAGGDAVHVDWNGPLVGAFSANMTHGTGGMNDAFDITARSATQLAQLTFSNNPIDFTSAGGTGIRVQTMGPSVIDVIGNTIDFNAGAPNGTGMNFTLASSASVNISTNNITDQVSGGTGVLFSSVTGPSTFQINNNLIQLLDPGAGFDRGIIFGAVTNTVTLSGWQDNVVTGASQSFFIPIGTSTGQIGVNGVMVP